jgi:hypothetical protein
MSRSIGRERLRIALLTVLGFCVAQTAAVGNAQAKRVSYEERRVDRELARRAMSVDPRPEGKRIAYVTVVREDVLAADEFWPTWPNTFHWLTKDSVVRRELLAHEGDAYRQDRIDESMRNLRDLAIFSLVRIVAVRTDDPKQVGLLVYTRDLWSLRLENGFSGAGNALYLTTQVSERNFLGLNKLLTARFDLDPKAFSLGQVYVDPRVALGELALRESFDVIFNRDSGHTEGSQGLLVLERPYYDLEQTWSYGTSASYAVYVNRTLRGADIKSFMPNGEGGVVQCDAPDPSCMRSVWNDRNVRASLYASYRRGEAYKQTFTWGAGVSDRAVAANAETELRPSQEETFKELMLPRARRQIYPYTSYDLWLPTYEVYRDLSTFGQSESVRTGPNVHGGVSAPLSVFGSSTDSVIFNGTLGYVLGDGSALLEGSSSASARYEDGGVVDQLLSGRLRGATPPWFFGRLVLYASWMGQRNDTSNTRITIGGDNGLRGYPSGAYTVIGGSRLRGNLEYRTLPLVIESVHIGAVAFYDAGSVYASLKNVQFHQSVGAGLRVLIPQFNRTPFCIDVGFPLQGGFSVLATYGTEQPVPLTATEDAYITSTVRPH